MSLFRDHNPKIEMKRQRYEEKETAAKRRRKEWEQTIRDGLRVLDIQKRGMVRRLVRKELHYIADPWNYNKTRAQWIEDNDHISIGYDADSFEKPSWTKSLECCSRTRKWKIHSLLGILGVKLPTNEREWRSSKSIIASHAGMGLAYDYLRTWLPFRKEGRALLSRSPIIDAMREKMTYDIVYSLLAAGLNPNRVTMRWCGDNHTDDEFPSALYYALKYGSYWIIQLLYDGGANPYHCREDYYTKDVPKESVRYLNALLSGSVLAFLKKHMRLKCKERFDIMGTRFIIRRQADQAFRNSFFKQVVSFLII